MRAAAVVGGLLLVGCGGGPQVEMAASPPSPTAEAIGATDPTLATDPRTGDVLLAWVGGSDSVGWQLYFARSTDGARSWSAPVQVTDRANDIHPHGESSPRLIAARGGALAVAWTNSTEVPGRRWPASNMRLARSTDGGATWSHAITLNDDTSAGPGGHIFHGAAVSGDSTLLVAWLDERGGASPGDSSGAGHPGHHPVSDAEADATIYLARSTDLGVRWKPNRALWGAACPCCRVSLTRRPDGSVVAAWRKHFPGSVRDPVIAPVNEAPGGGVETRVATDNWVYPGCPHTGPGVAVDARGATHVAWYVGKRGAAGVFYARTTGGSDAAFGNPIAVITAPWLPTAHPRVVALQDGGALVASDIDARGRPALVVTRIWAAGQTAGRTAIGHSSGADHPDMIALTDGTTLVAWSQPDGKKPAVRVARVQN